MQVRVIITATGSAIGPLFDIYAVNGGSISTLIASDVVPSTLFGSGIVYTVPNDTIQIKIVNIESDGSAGVCDDYIMDIMLSPTTTSTTTEHVVVPTTTTTTSETPPTTTTTTTGDMTSSTTTTTTTTPPTTTTTTTSEIPGPTTTTTTTFYVDTARCFILTVNTSDIPETPYNTLWANVLIPGNPPQAVIVMLTDGEPENEEHGCVCSTDGFEVAWSNLTEPSVWTDPAALNMAKEDTGVGCDEQIDCGGCWNWTPATTTTSTTGEPTTTTTTTNEVMLSCSDFGVSFENNLSGNDNQWSAWINLPVAATGDTDFEIGFAATRNDTLGSCSTTINVTVLSGQTMGIATSMTCIENIQAESWTVDSWEIVSITPDTGKYNKIYCGVR